MNIKVKNLSKTFGKQIVFSDLNFELTNGETYCLLGKNGAGKTTLINIIIKLLKPDSGVIFYDKTSYSNLPVDIKRRMGVLSEDNPIIEELTARQFLKLSGGLYKMDSGTIEQRTNDLLSWFFDHPEEVRDKRLSGFSTGMKKKIGLIAAVLHTPDLLILDEPFSGLDPLAARQCVDFINVYRNVHRTIFLSSHDLGYVEQVATQVIVLDQQNFTFNGTLNDLIANGSSHHINSALLELLQPEGQKNVKPEWL
ncbi:MAG: ABC transporter ATP-binding protein [Balneolales bacterium]